MRLTALVTALLVAGATLVAAPVQAAAPAPPTAGPALAATPPMGFNNWNAFGCEVSETLIKETADVLVSSGLRDLGYEYVNIDDCWSLRERGPDGRLVPDPDKFPGGIDGVADYVHAKGLKLGIYGDAGTRTCAGYPGSLGHEEIDARTWAGWGVDYLKYDNCNNQSDGSQEDYIRRYTAMRDALARTGRPIVYSICEWGTSQPWTWAEGVGQLWRTTGDISDDWSSVRSIIRQNAPLAPYAGPGHWNDPDMLEIGNGGMTATEYRTHMSMWAMMAAPLIIGTDLRAASAETLEILGNREIIAVDQDRLGVQGAVVSDENGLMVLDKPLAGGDRAIALYNSTDTLATVGVAAADTGLRRAGAYRLRDLWTGRTLQARSTISAAVPAHGTVVYRVSPLRGPGDVPPSVVAGAALGTVVPADGGTLTTAVTNRGAGDVRDVKVTVRTPEGWTATATGPSGSARLRTDAALETAWRIGVPATAAAGRHPIEITAAYRWGRRSAGTSSEIVAVVVTAPGDGRRHLSTVAPVSTVNATGPVEADQSNGGPLEDDGNLITIGGRVYQRGLGTTTGSEISYYLGGRCSRLVTDVGVDDEAAAGAPATFTVHADARTAATSGPMTSGQAPATLTADLTGADWLRLTAESGAAAVHADWASPVLTCGDVPDDSPVLPVSRTLFSFETGTDGFTIANPGDGGTVARSPLFHTHGTSGLKVSTPVAGNWFGRPLDEPLDLTGTSMLRFDVRAGEVGTVGEIAIQVGEDMSWCQGGRWGWIGPHSSRTVTERFDQIACPLGVTLDLADVRAVWVFLNTGGDVHIDDVRAE
ncbi:MULTISPECIES: NPCBM/NEW2 domain-containing protein [Nonomuraea]|uniref:Alpha-galactosidase n=2 Tax=Nonomuraea ferruginea TaxID=46174 RepID=A0ABT4TAC1_9ACTN|nr:MULTISPECIES: NPCBM/NEW2 domain-containing protein [Nonomuraea]MDA0646442.1 NPCBM/NEW2 domain-containing protein [Nonomuraea ferruginea]TXK42446.1 alpha-galactosidase [Nonomuraea sp. C10]